MASHSCFHKSVAKAMFSTRVEQESSEFLREFKKKKKTRKITLVRMWHKTKWQFSNFVLESGKDT